MLHVNASTLRFWEKEFNLNPKRNKKGDRFYTPDQLEELKFICHLLKDRKLTIEGARKILDSGKENAQHNWEVIKKLEAIRSDLLMLKEQLENYDKNKPHS